MTNYAQLTGNYVSNIIAAYDKEEAEAVLGCALIEITAENNAGIGFTYDAETGLFINPNAAIEESAEETPVE